MDNRTPFNDLLGILRRRKWFIIAFVALLTAVPTIYGIRLQPKYTAMASIVIEPQQSRIINLQEVVPKSLPDVGVIGAQADIIRSRELIAQTIADLDLFQDPEFQKSPSAIDRGSELIRQTFPQVASWLDNGLRAWAGPVAAATGDEEAIPGPSGPIDPRETVIDIVASQLEISQPGDSYVLRVSFSSVDPEKSARIVNRLIARFLDKQLRDKIAATQNANSWLSDRLQTMQEEVLNAEHQAAEFRSNNRLAAGNDISLTDSQLADLTLKLNEVQAAKAEQEAKLQTARVRGSDAIGEVLASPVVSDLRMQDAALVRRDAELATDFGERHPMRVAAREESAKLKQRIDQEIARIVDGIRSKISVLASQESTLAAAGREPDQSVGS